MRVAVVACCVLAPGCSGDLAFDVELSRATIGPSGGAVALADGARLEIPPGALTRPTEIGIAVDDAEPDGRSIAVGRTYRCEPEGLVLDERARITLPFDVSQVPPDTSLPNVLVVTARPDTGALEVLATFQNASASTASASSSRLSRFWVAVLPPQACNGNGTSGRQCDDGDPCTFGDFCETECAGEAYDCDDGDPCTADVCDGLGGCLHDAGAGQECGVDPCTILNGGCGDPEYWRCTTNPGGAPSCSDVDECATNNGGCGAEEHWHCSNNAGAGPTCADVDECAIHNGGCGAPEYWHCSNNTGAAPTCVDVDECAVANGGCGNPARWSCINNSGASPSCFDVNECATEDGGCGDPEYWLCSNNLGDAPTCTDIDECAKLNGECGDPRRWTCTNNIGAAATCADIDECATSNGGCGDPQRWRCTNQIGLAPICSDVNECATDNGGCGEPERMKCINQTGAPPKCTDINECATDNGGCGDPGAWKCTNYKGFPPSCSDINDCAMDNGGCGDPTYWTCINWIGAIRSCTPVDHCATNNGGCGSAACWSCVNNDGAPPTCSKIDGCTPEPTGALVLYFGGLRNGDLGGRAGIDALCEGSRPAGVSWGKGFMSVSDGDQIQDVVPPELRQLPVVTVYGERLASNWYGLFDSSLDRNLNPVVGASLSWSGAGRNGGAVSHTCGGWDSVSGSGSYGCGGMTDGSALCCSPVGCMSGGPGAGLVCTEYASVACVGHAEQNGPVKAPWCPPGALLHAGVSPRVDWGTAVSFEVDAGGVLHPAGSGGSIDHPLTARVCNARNSARTLDIEIRGSDCIDCQTVFEAVPAGRCVWATFSAARTSLPEFCISANVECSTEQTGHTRCLNDQQLETCDGAEWVAGQDCTPLPCFQPTPELAHCYAF